MAFFRNLFSRDTITQSNTCLQSLCENLVLVYVAPAFRRACA